MFSFTRRYLSRTTNRAAILLSGSGVFDGSEIHEAVSMIVHLSRLQVQYQCFSLDKSFTATNHLTGQDYQQPRNMLEESARIARGNIQPLASLDPAQFDALFLPGGFGIAKNFSDFASNNENLTVDQGVSKVILAFYQAKKPIGAACIAPILLAKILGTAIGNQGIDLTLGKKGEEWPYSGSLDVANKLGNKVINCDIDDICKDRYSKIVTTPAYMKESAKAHEVFDGIEKLVKEVIKLSRA